MKIAITGATGLLGANLSRLLCAKGHQLLCLRRASSRWQHLSDLPVRWSEADVLQPQSLERAFKGYEVVVHCAGLVGYGPVLGPRMQLVNVQGTANVLAAARSCGVQRVLHCSSVDALGLPEAGQLGNESLPWNWDKRGYGYAYPRSKCLSEQLVLEAAQHELDALVVNPTFMIGPYDARPSSGKLVLEIAKGRAPFYPTGANNFVPVTDVCQGILTALERGKRGERYILGGENCSYAEFFTRVAQQAGRRSLALPLPPVLGTGAGWLCDLYSRLSRRPIDVGLELVALGRLQHVYSSQKAQRELGYTTSSLNVAIQQALEWFRSQRML